MRSVQHRAQAALRRDGLARNVAWLAGGSLVGQGATLVAAPLLARQYGPQAFGVLAVFTAVVSILAAAGSLRLDAAIIIPPDDEDATALAWLALTAGAVTAGAVLATTAVAPQLSRALGVTGLASLWWLVAAATLVTVLAQVATSWLVRLRAYPWIAFRNAAQGTTAGTTQIGAGLLTHQPIGLVAGFTVGQLAAAGGLLSPRGLFRQPFPSRRQLARMLARYRRFAILGTGSALLNTTGQQAPLLLISALYGSTTVGLLGLALRVLATPVALLGTAVANAFRGELSARRREGGEPLAPFLRKTTLGLAAAGAAPALLLVIAGPQLFSLAFGSRWTAAGGFAQALAVAYWAQFVASPVSQTLPVLERQGLQLGWDAGRLVLVLAAPLLVWAGGGNAHAAVLVLSAAQVVAYAWLFALCHGAASQADTSVTI